MQTPRLKNSCRSSPAKGAERVIHTGAKPIEQAETHALAGDVKYASVNSYTKTYMCVFNKGERAEGKHSNFSKNVTQG